MTGLSTLCNHRFTREGHRSFALLSGDWNPLHLDPVVARREIFGTTVAHGVEVLMRGLEGLLISRDAGRERLVALHVAFDNPVHTGSVVDYRVSGSSGATIELEGYSDDVRVLRSGLTMEPIVGPERQDSLPPASAEPRAPRDLHADELHGAAGRLALEFDRTSTAHHFPALVRALPAGQVACILALTRLVGMECPGLHSLFSSLDVHFRQTGAAKPLLVYRVRRWTRALSRVEIEVDGSVEGRVTAFRRPTPTMPLSVSALTRRIEPKEFADQVALLVGGSRGIGAATARILTAGGGVSIVAYRDSADEAEKLISELRAAGATCQAIRCDVVDACNVRQAVSAMAWEPTHVYHFASPRIFVPRRGSFDQDLFERFSRVYVGGLATLHAALRERTSEPLALFYPSTEAITAHTASLREYASAKAAGEFLCALLAATDRQLSVLVERLPRTATDQTLSLVPYPARDPVDVMLPLLRKMCPPP